MAGNSQRRGARRTEGSKKGALLGTGGQKPKALAGRGPTPKATDRPHHPAARRAKSAEKRAPSSARSASTTQSAGRSTAPSGQHARRTGRSPKDASETVVGRNPVVEALRAGVPATALYVANRIDSDDRVKEALTLAAKAGVALLEAPRTELDRLAGGSLHQGLALQVPPYEYAHPDDIIERAVDAAEPALVVALDGVTDPRNLGAVVRSVAAFGGHGVIVPERRAAGMTSAAWRTSAGAAARVQVARVTNLTRSLVAMRDAGLFVVGLDADGDISLHDLEASVEPLVLVVGSEGKGLSRLVRETCDVVVSIPMSGGTESLNAGVAAGVALYEVARRRAARR